MVSIIIQRKRQKKGQKGFTEEKVGMKLQQIVIKIL